MSQSKEIIFSDFEIELGEFECKNQKGEIYHVIPAEKCHIGIVSRRRIGSLDETEAAFIRGNGAWLPPFFGKSYNPTFPQ